MKTIKYISLLIFLFALLSSCKKDTFLPKTFFEVGTQVLEDQSGQLDSIQLVGRLLFEEQQNEQIVFGFLYSNTNPELSFDNLEDVNEILTTQRTTLENGFEFTTYIEDFSIKKPLYVAAFARLEVDGKRELLGEVVTFIPGSQLLLEITKTSVENSKAFLETIAFNLEGIYDATAIQHGHVYAKLAENPNPRIDGSNRRLTKLDKLNDDGAILDTLPSLVFNTTYVARPYLQLNSGTIFHGDTVHFRVKDGWTRLLDNAFGGIKEGILAKIESEQKVYLGLGCGAPFCESDNAITEIWQFDAASKEPRLFGNVSDEAGILGREGATAFAIGEDIYLGFGRISSFGAVVELGDFWRFSPKENNSFERWEGIGALEALKRSNAVAFTIGDKAYVGLGQLRTKTSDGEGDTTIFKNDFYEFDPSNIETPEGPWRKVADFPTGQESRCNGAISRGRREAVSFSMNGFGYVATGFFNSLSLNDFWKFDPNANDGMGAWTCMDDFPLEVTHGAVAFAMEEKNKAYICTGEKFNNIYHPDTWEFDGATETWTKKTNFPGLGRQNALGFALNNKGYVIGGWRRIGTNTGVISEILPDIWEYTPEEN